MKFTLANEKYVINENDNTNKTQSRNDYYENVHSIIRICRLRDSLEFTLTLNYFILFTN